MSRRLSDALAALGLVLPIALGAAALPGCGDSAEPPAGAALPALPPVLGHSEAHGGDERVGAAALGLPLPGPTLRLAQPAWVHVRITGQAAATVHYGARLSAAVALSAPWATGPSEVSAAAEPGAPAALPLAYEVWLQLPAGEHALQAQVLLRAWDVGGQATGALAVADAEVDWRVEVQP